MTEYFKHSPERDKEVFRLIEEKLSGSFTLVAELLSIARKWRSKAQMRTEQVAELESEVVHLEDEIRCIAELHD